MSICLNLIIHYNNLREFVRNVHVEEISVKIHKTLVKEKFFTAKAKYRKAIKAFKYKNK